MIPAMHGKRRLSPIAFYISALLIATLDQLSKAIVLAKMPLGEQGTIPLIPGIFHFTHVRNTGIAFSMLEGKIPVILIASAVVMLGIILTERKAAGRLGMAYGIALSMPLGGALGNMIDRIRFGLGHFIAKLIHGEAICNNRAVRRDAADSRCNHQG